MQQDTVQGAAEQPGSDNGAQATDITAKPVFPVVGLGASAGGLRALQQFFQVMPADSGMAFVVIMHLSPEHESHAASILQHATTMPVLQVTEPVPVEPNRVYVIPPAKSLAMNDGMIVLSHPQRPRGQQVAVDLFFRTLAETHTTHAACIVLSGMGADGSVGIKRVKETGGVAIAQDPQDAEYDAMPRHAINTGMVDWVLPVADMPQRLVAWWQNVARITLPPPADAAVVDESQAAADALGDVLAAVRTRTGHDFSHYKHATILRRIERRMQVTTTSSLPAYRDYLREHGEEASLLFQDLLIGVTKFFRDRQAFDALEREVVPRLFDGKTGGDVIRVWVAGCATGEEAYSVAILLLEHAAHVPHPPTIQVFATDIDEAAIAAARDGSYPQAIEADVSPQRLRTFFTREAGGYNINNEVRERVLFASHNLIKDPPFSKLDLITCRNLLIYLNRDVQEQAFNLFHFALRPGGFLFLGSSESTDGASTLFAPINGKQRLFRANPAARSARTVPALPLEAPAKPPRARSDTTMERRRIAFGELHQRMLEHYAPPSIVVNTEYEIVHLSAHAGRFIQHGGGEPSLNLLEVVLLPLRLELRTALFQAFHSGKATEARRVQIAHAGRTSYVNMIVRPERDPATNAEYALVLFAEVDEILGTEGKTTDDGVTEPVVRHLEDENQRLKAQLQATVEQHETGVEELRASNEELQAINEELRSTTEELETSKEELQSVNEELRTVNDELKHKVDEVSAANDDLSNLMSSTDIATVFLDRSLRVKRYTPRALDLFNLIQQDEGRPLSDITHKLQYDTMLGDANTVLRTLQPIERDVASLDGRFVVVRMVPYRTTDDRIDGVVLTFVDITARKQGEAALRRSEERLRLLIESDQDYAIYTMTPERVVDSWNSGAERIFGYTEREILGQSGDILFTPEDRERHEAVHEADTARTAGRAADERWHLRKDGSRFYASGVLTPLRDGDLHGFVKIARDLTDHKQAEEALRESEARYRMLFDSIDEGFCTVEVMFDEHNTPTDYRFIEVNQVFETMTGLHNALGKTARELVPDLEPFWFETYGNVALTGEAVRFENRSEPMERWFDVYASRVGDDTSRTIAIVFTNITERKQMENVLRESEMRFRHMADNAPVMVWVTEADATCSYLSQSWYDFTGQTPDTGLGHGWLDAAHPDDRAQTEQSFLAAHALHVPLRLEYRLRRGDGEYRWVIDSAVPRFTETGDFLGYIGSVLDIQERKRAEEVVRESEERLRALLAKGADMITISDRDGTILYASPSTERVSGYTADEFVGSNPFAESIHPDDMPRCRDAFAQLLATPGLSLVVEHRARYKHGGWHWFEGTFTSLFHDPAVGGLVANVRDITERKAAQEELARLYAAEQAARAEAEAALQTRDQFLSIASHELRTPLTSLMGYASMLSRAAARSTGQVDKMTDRIVRQAQRLNGLIDQLLDVSRLQRGQFVIERQPVDLAALVVQMVDEVRAALPTNTNHVVELIRPDEPVVVAGDVQRLEQVIQNLLSNAIKYSPKGGLMRVAVLRTATNAALEVTDQGIGIPSEAQAHLFEPFYRAANVGGQMSGFGLGLHIVREIVERHGGRVEVESIEDQGSTFRVVLPLP